MSVVVEFELVLVFVAVLLVELPPPPPVLVDPTTVPFGRRH